MHLLILHASARTNGNTRRITDRYITALGKEIGSGFTSETVLVSDASLGTCKGCRLCFDKGASYCPHKDNLNRIVNSMQKADLVIFASPVYVEDVSGTMKTFLDRCAYFCHRPAFFGKRAFIVTTSGSGSTNHTIRTMKNAASAWGFSVIGSAKYKTGAWMSDSDMAQSYDDEIAKQVSAIAKKVGKPAVPSLYSLISFRIIKRIYSKRPDEQNLDYIYWYERGWLTPSAKYYIPCRIPLYKRLIAGVASTVLGRVCG
ncbi:MAG: flavodoxin family protein [Anaerofustis sp.]